MKWEESRVESIFTSTKVVDWVNLVGQKPNCDYPGSGVGFPQASTACKGVRQRVEMMSRIYYHFINSVLIRMADWGLNAIGCNLSLTFQV